MLVILKDFLKLGLQIVCDSDKKYHVIVICNHDFDYFREVIDYDCDYIVFSMNVIDYDYEFAIVIVIVLTIAITDYDYPMPELLIRSCSAALEWRCSTGIESLIGKDHTQLSVEHLCLKCSTS